MLQQTRVATVIDYWLSWTRRWPTIQSLAAAKPADVLSAWRGLGYYSRATRIHQAAQKVVADPELRGLLPSRAAELEKQVPGVGKYTAGAISSIVFGRAEAILDGNVARVLSRQLAHRANPKAKATTDFLWATAQRLVEAVAGHSRDDGEEARSEKPGKWNQALMELGSTLCTPQQPRCHECPIRGACRAYAEGEALAVARGQMHKSLVIHPRALEVGDIEDLCEDCEPLDEAEEGEGAAAGKKRKVAGEEDGTPQPAAKKVAKQGSLLAHFGKKSNGTTQAATSQSAETSTTATPSLRSLPPAALATIQSHVKHYPLKAVKAKVREQDCIVCVVEHRGYVNFNPNYQSSLPPRRDWLLEQRPDTGLLASLWEFPTLMLPPRDELDAEVAKAAKTKKRQKGGKRSRHDRDSEEERDPEEQDDDEEEGGEGAKKGPRWTPRSELTALQAQQFVIKRIFASGTGAESVSVREFMGTVPHVFSHLKLHMHIFRFYVSGTKYDKPDARCVPAWKEGEKENVGRLKWCEREEVERESMGTGMRNVWALVGKWKEDWHRDEWVKREERARKAIWG